MRIKLTKRSGKLYLAMRSDFMIGEYFLIGDYKNKFWYFNFGQLFSYSDGLNYKFRSQADVEKLLEDMCAVEFENKVAVYDVDAAISRLKIELV